MTLSKTPHGIHTGCNVFGDTFVANNLFIFTSNGVTAKQTVKASSVFFLESSFEILHKSMPVDLLLKYLPVHGIIVYLLYGGDRQ